jgi:hypothetical protein
MAGVCCDAADPFANLSDRNTLFDWESSLAQIDSDFAKWCWDHCSRMAPDLTSEQIDLSVEFMLATASPSSHRFIWCCLMGFDLRPMLRHVTQPTLVIHGRDDRLYPVQHGRYFAEHIPGAEYFETPSGFHVPMFDRSILPQLHERIGRFISGLPRHQLREDVPRFVSTVLFTDIVDSTTQQRESGDQIWTEKISRFEKSSAEIVEKCRGKVAGRTGDGIIATFEVPGDGLRAARLLVEDADRLGHPIRAGAHTGEVQLTTVRTAWPLRLPRVFWTRQVPEKCSQRPLPRALSKVEITSSETGAKWISKGSGSASWFSWFGAETAQHSVQGRFRSSRWTIDVVIATLD